MVSFPSFPSLFNTANIDVVISVKLDQANAEIGAFSEAMIVVTTRHAGESFIYNIRNTKRNTTLSL